MFKGDIDNSVTPRLLLRFEGLVGILRDDETEEAPKHRRGLLGRLTGRAVPPPSVKAYEPNWPLAIRIWDATWRMGYSVDTVTFLGEEFLEPIQAWVDEADLPLGHVTFHSSPQALAARLAYMPHVAAIYDPDPANRLMYGAKSRVINPNKPELF